MYPHFNTAAKSTLSSVLAVALVEQLTIQPVTLLAGAGSPRDLALGTVLGKRLFGAPVIAAKAGGNTGTGALGTLTLGDACKVGTYTVTCTAAAADGGRFQVVDPGGYRLADALVGVAYVSPQIAFTVADGGTDYAVGDGFTVSVPEGDEKVVQLDTAAHDGTQLAAGILAEHAVAPDGIDTETRAIVIDAIVLSGGMVWPAGISNNAQAAALDRLLAASIHVRTAV